MEDLFTESYVNYQDFTEHFENGYPVFLQEYLYKPPLHTETNNSETSTDNILNFSKYHDGPISEITFNHIKTIIDNIDFTKDYTMKELYLTSKKTISKTIKTNLSVPKKQTSFNIYVKQMKATMTKSNPQNTKSDIMKHIAYEWGKKTKEEKKKFLN